SSSPSANREPEEHEKGSEEQNVSTRNQRDVGSRNPFWSSYQTLESQDEEVHPHGKERNLRYRPVQDPGMPSEGHRCREEDPPLRQIHPLRRYQKVHQGLHEGRGRAQRHVLRDRALAR